MQHHTIKTDNDMTISRFIDLKRVLQKINHQGIIKPMSIRKIKKLSNENVTHNPSTT